MTFLALHLGYGGIEKAVIDQANLLSEKYKVEIIVVYKLFDKPAFKVCKKITIKYLLNYAPNKQDWLASIKNLNIIIFFKETIKALKTLYLRKKLMIETIKNSDSSVIISTRIIFTQLLSKYGDNNVFKIAEEHVYHKNKNSYKMKLKKACRNIDVLLPSSHYLTHDYQQLLSNEPILVKYIPIFLDYYPKTTSKLDNFNLVSIGRLEKEKGFFDLIEVFNKLNKLDPRFSLNIIGDGSLKNELQNKIDFYGLNSKVKLMGYQNKEVINDILSESSLYVMTSYEESFGIVLIEAMSFGIPCIAFDSALGATEIIDKNKDGFIIEDRNKTKMAKTILKYFNNDKTKFSENAIIKSLFYSKSSVRKKWFELIEIDQSNRKKGVRNE